MAARGGEGPLAIQEASRSPGGFRDVLNTGGSSRALWFSSQNLQTELNCNSNFRGMMPSFGFHRTACMRHTYMQTKTSCKILKPKSKWAISAFDTRGPHSLSQKAALHSGSRDQHGCFLIQPAKPLFSTRNPVLPQVKLGHLFLRQCQVAWGHPVPRLS